MTAFDAATEAHINELVEQAPPLTTEQAALVVRLLTPKATDAPASDNAA